MNIVEKAKEYARQFHKEHKRISGKPYIEHIENTVKNLIDNKIEDEVILSAAYLKHILNFDETKEKELEEEFGSDILSILKKYKKVSDNPIKQVEPKDINESFIIQAYLGLIDDYRILLIRLAAKVEDSQTLVHLPKSKAVKVAQRALHIYSPVARIVSLRNFAMQLENNAFKVLYPDVYRKIEKKLTRMDEKATNFLKLTIPPLKQLFEENDIKVVDIKTRLKHIYGIFRKEQYFKTKNRYVGKNYEGIRDILGLRIIVDTVESCYKAEDILKQLWEPMPEERDDFITNPRASGYKAIHNTFNTEDITFETQILTKDMYEYNEFGPAKHTIYKLTDKDKSVSTKNIDRFRNYLNDYLESLEKVTFHEPIIKGNKNKIYVFTPKSDIIELPVGANIIDFAYAIHADVGNGAIGALVNGENKKLNYSLENGDVIYVKTSKGKKYPSEDWIKEVKTAKARAYIRKALRRRERENI